MQVRALYPILAIVAASSAAPTDTNTEVIHPNLYVKCPTGFAASLSNVIIGTKLQKVASCCPYTAFLDNNLDSNGHLQCYSPDSKDATNAKAPATRPTCTGGSSVSVCSKDPNGCCVGSATPLVLPGLLPNQKRASLDVRGHTIHNVTCGKGSSPQNQDVWMPNAHLRKISACCTNGFNLINLLNGDDNSLLCTHPVNAYKLTNGMGIANQGTISYQSCTNGAKPCPDKLNGCCWGDEYAPKQ